jgi:imidazolonepropionase-like amidohydrolase
MNMRNLAAAAAAAAATVAVALLALLGATPAHAQRPAPPESWRLRRQGEPPWVLAGGTIVDVTTGKLLRNRYIVIVGDQIASIADAKPPGTVRTVDITGLYVVPGFFDLHAHIQPSPFDPKRRSGDEILRTLLANGVTAVRGLPFTTEYGVAMAARVNDGSLPGPTIVPASSIFEQTPQRTSMGFKDPATAASWVEREALLGARWIKVYNSMDPPSLTAIVQAARRTGLKVFGHAHQVPPKQASELGITSIEHITGLPLSCLRDKVQFDHARQWPGLATREAWLWSNADEERCRALMDVFLAHRTAWVPTLVVSEAMTRSGSHDGKAELLDDAARKALQRGIELSAKLAVYLHRKGGLVGLGTDFPIDGVAIGESVHREMELLIARGGATPLEALQIATLRSAAILDVGALLGTVEAGKLASLVVLTKDPLEAIANTRTIKYVVRDGKLYEPAALASVK